jgi:integrase
MATIRPRANGTFELRIVHRCLPKPYYTTHDTREQAQAYASRLIEALNSGYVPPELQQAKAKPDIKVSVLLRDYLRRGRISESDRPVVCWLQESVSISTRELTVRWVDEWIKGMKTKEHLAPGTIRKKVESLARGIDWWMRDTGTDMTNPLRTLPKGYSRYAEGEGHPEHGARTDAVRDRRLHSGEQERIEAAILARTQPEAFLALFRLILDTGLRLREAYTLTWGQIRFDLKTIHIARSKTGKARDVPMLPQVHDRLLQARPEPPVNPQARLFPFWSGSPEDLGKCSARLSHKFAAVFKRAGCVDLREHDLRHEAVCRWMLLKDETGRWLFRPEEVRRITGHLNVQQFERYLSLRGSDLSERLWSEPEPPKQPNPAEQ